jgi:hypothetical protein
MTLRDVLLAQGGYYAVTGAMPFVSRRLFEAVTGRKRDWWLVEAVGAVVMPVGLGLVAAARSERMTSEVVGIAVGCAGGLAAIDVRHVLRGHIPPVYLVDATLQTAALAALAHALRSPEERSRLTGPWVE